MANFIKTKREYHRTLRSLTDEEAMYCLNMRYALGYTTGQILQKMNGKIKKTALQSLLKGTTYNDIYRRWYGKAEK